MYKMTNIETLGTEYNVSGKNGKIIRVVQLITANEILTATLGPYNEDFSSMKEYLEKSIELLSGFEKVDYLRTLWFATYDDDIDLTNLIQYAINNGYEKIIVEHLEKLD